MIRDSPPRFHDHSISEPRAVPALAAMDRAYVDAYRWFAGLTLLGATVGLVGFVAVSEDDVATVEITWGAAMAVFWTLEGLA